ncbi:hypothetical protein KUCAC02_016784 [Chaenocephalus aceratus]|nr:hypothetical protein KUCAC02_016784 [Chaenocephalus aceratus]
MESVGASPQSIWSIKVESNGLADGEMREKGLPGGQLLRWCIAARTERGAAWTPSCAHQQINNRRPFCGERALRAKLQRVNWKGLV